MRPGHHRFAAKLLLISPIPQPWKLDNVTKECLAIEVDQNLKAEDLVAVMERLRHQRTLQQRIQTTMAASSSRW
ncbi:hypothetical protein [Xanthomonas vasicola]|uniref:hypothetical protein n=1 Tax=Xanthomonas vasicola TaxID=56459 RepID=UPI000B445EBA|nr:hypothetical protein [Xanthomonas vasicola]AZR29754.1 hypothetical protein KWO_003540 [Xanthomonas vasicola pv. musacearum NCPPB 4379]MBV7290485.1 hypothetical protein [Xanthomonas vasicola pv. musacearum]AVQ05846.1 hypothetical protein C7V42_03610 [Xanthomonas vasicola pv. vasculorum]AZM70045.1 hypothetical protein CXP37_03615 [Xanthomonas vasicola pv. vasculorum]OWF61719.1 hypothetical protein B1H32_07965 [Xanthomonas vasicola pv. vasculorum]